MAGKVAINGARPDGQRARGTGAGPAPAGTGGGQRDRLERQVEAAAVMDELAVALQIRALKSLVASAIAAGTPPRTEPGPRRVRVRVIGRRSGAGGPARGTPIRPRTCLGSPPSAATRSTRMQPLAAAGPVVRSAVVAVVVDLHGEVVVPVGDAHRRGGRPGMAGGVGQRLPHGRNAARPTPTGSTRTSPWISVRPPGPPHAPARPAHPAGRVSRWAIGAGAAGEEVEQPAELAERVVAGLVDRGQGTAGLGR